MKKTILLNNQIYDYTLTRKSQKNCYLRVASGQIKVSAPRTMPLEMIEQFIVENKDRLIETINQYQPTSQYIDGGYVYIFGQRYTLVLKDRKQMRCMIVGQTLEVYHVSIEKAVRNYLKNELYGYCMITMNEYIEQYFELKKPIVEIKKYKSRWGSYYHGLHKITFNESLIHVSKELIDYVVMHELCHALQKNHSPLFYQEVCSRMPDYKQREKKLKKETI